MRLTYSGRLYLYTITCSNPIYTTGVHVFFSCYLGIFYKVYFHRISACISTLPDILFFFEDYINIFLSPVEPVFYWTLSCFPEPSYNVFLYFFILLYNIHSASLQNKKIYIYIHESYEVAPTAEVPDQLTVLVNETSFVFWTQPDRTYLRVPEPTCFGRFPESCVRSVYI